MEWNTPIEIVKIKSNRDSFRYILSMEHSNPNYDWANAKSSSIFTLAFSPLTFSLTSEDFPFSKERAYESNEKCYWHLLALKAIINLCHFYLSLLVQSNNFHSLNKNVHELLCGVCAPWKKSTTTTEISLRNFYGEREIFTVVVHIFRIYIV